MTKSEYTCIICPMSCRILVEDDNGALTISGHTCPRGENHARNEHTNPQRMLTTTVAVKGGVLPRLPVVSSAEIARSKLDHCLKVLYGIQFQAPVRCGDVIVENVLGTGVNIIASRSLSEHE